MKENQLGIGTLARWTAERALKWPPAPHLLGEINARRVISQDILADRIRPLSKSGVGRRTEGLVRYLERVVAPGEERVAARTDSLTGVDYEVFLSRTEDGWMAGERRRGGEPFSRAFIGTDGGTRLTLDFTADRFARMKANPGIVDSERYPRAAVKVFALLATGFVRA